jgi:hypothetical protein
MYIFIFIISLFHIDSESELGSCCKCNDVGYVFRINSIVGALNWVICLVTLQWHHMSNVPRKAGYIVTRQYSSKLDSWSIPLLRREEPCSHSFRIESHWLHNVMTSKGRLLNLFLVMQSRQAWHNASTSIKTWKVSERGKVTEWHINAATLLSSGISFHNVDGTVYCGSESCGIEC